LDEEKTIQKMHSSWFHYSVLLLSFVVFLTLGIVVAGKSETGSFMKILGIFLIILAFFMLIWAVVSRFCRRYKITNLRVIAIEGLLSRKTSEVEIKDIRNIQIEQSFFHRLLRIGTVKIGTAGTAGVEVVLKVIPRPLRTRDLVRAQRNALDVDA